MTKARELAELSRTVSDSADAVAITINASEDVTFSNDITVTGTATADGFQTGTSNTNFNLLARNSSNTAVYIQNGGSGNILDVQSGSMAAGQGTSRLLVDASGNATLSGTVSVGDSLFLRDGSTTRGKIELNASDTDDIDIIAVSLGSNLKFHTVGAEVGRFDASGNFGIGTVPAKKLNVVDSSALQAQFSGYSHASAANNARAASGSVRIGDGSATTGLLLDYSDQGQTLALIKNEYVATTSSELRLQSPFLSFYTGTSATEAMRIGSAGAVTKPNQPAFLVTKNANQNNIAINLDVVVTWTTEVFDVGSNFNISTNVFDADVSGKYQLSSNIRIDNIDTSASYYIVSIFTSNRLFRAAYSMNRLAADPDYWAFTLSITADMDAGDHAWVTINQGGGSVQADVSGDVSYTQFSGYLLG